jgi:hypothetical protein
MLNGTIDAEISWHVIPTTIESILVQAILKKCGWEDKWTRESGIGSQKGHNWGVKVKHWRPSLLHRLAPPRS